MMYMLKILTNVVIEAKLLHQFAPSLCKIPVYIKEEILYKHLMKLQQEDSDWYFNIDFEGIKVEKEEQAAM
ncbi:unnamed protein product [Rhizophagus irregularis]|uniref:Uncharacterized protein n=1 Tax=Rhizophagus irregularis TaxID=588596 RepID=A0A2N1M5N4_9GLOM|nr:hypothetical protein RhiirC2_799079 [Rhizophagus irregularis]CAB5357761.1 unnamed protein product [Rhizophagus irregularis]